MAAAPAGRETPGRARLRRGRRPARAPVQKRREIAAQRRQKDADAHPSGGPQRVTVHPDIDVSGSRTANHRGGCPTAPVVVSAIRPTAFIESPGCAARSTRHL
ncbi:hypothetical protein GCM10010392_27610 [Streptomyces clavifer]|nr:hypothetical protein GCM10010392_27610 [Streptomyces clavifer]